MDFAVQIKGTEFEGDKASWVLAVDPVGERVLIAHTDQTLHWYAMADCTFVRAATPDTPRLVMAVQPQPQIALPTIPNRAMRRNGA